MARNIKKQPTIITKYDNINWTDILNINNHATHITE